ncbi:acyltransferase [Mesorhizobium sp. VNQ89]|uniref:acyltransferase n=1 Tax=Mesorhizobium quangtriensis TaxID=3157709 RepID=UPI0032B7302D
MKIVTPLMKSDGSGQEGDARPGGQGAPRRHDLDWLRICAFGVLILYHIGLSYVTWDNAYVSSRYSSTFIEPAMGLVSSLAALFFISGVAVRFAVDKVPLRDFVQERFTRLFVPLVFGSLVLCVPLSYITLRFRDEIPAGYLVYYRDYLGFGQYAFSVPDAHHLWYVAAILTYMMIIAAFLPVWRTATKHLAEPFFAWLAGGGFWRVLLVPAIPFILYVAALDIYLSQFDVGSWAGPARTFSYFLLGFMAAKNEDFWRAIDKAFPAAIGLSLLLGGLLLAAWINQFELDRDARLLYAALLLKPFYSWSILVLVLGLARRFASRRTRLLAYLTTGIFPYYILHMPIIVMVSYWFTMHEAPMWVELATILGVTLFGCVLGYEIIRRIPVLRPLFGLPIRPGKSTAPPKTENRSPAVADLNR